MDSGYAQISIPRDLAAVAPVESGSMSRSPRSPGNMQLLDDGLEIDPLDLEEDVFALSISDLAGDLKLWAECAGSPAVHYARITTILFLLCFTLFTQVFVMVNIKRFVTARSVHDIRISYDEYEIHMYGNDTSRMDLTPNLKHRGRAEYFDVSLFDTLTEQEKEKACKIPLSQPYFFGIILVIWTTVCLSELQKTLKRLLSVIFRTKTCASMVDCFKCGDDQEVFFQGEEAGHQGRRVIYQLTRSVKALILLVILLPRVAINCVLLWLGCRWLLATTSFSDLILNAVALTFVLDLGTIFYHAAAPERSKHDLNRTKMLPAFSRWNFEIGYKQCVQVFVFFFVCLTWVFFYMTTFQRVLPDYRWDVHAACVEWIKKRFAV